MQRASNSRQISISGNRLVLKMTLGRPVCPLSSRRGICERGGTSDFNSPREQYGSTGRIRASRRICICRYLSLSRLISRVALTLASGFPRFGKLAIPIVRGPGPRGTPVRTRGTRESPLSEGLSPFSNTTPCARRFAIDGEVILDDNRCKACREVR